MATTPPTILEVSTIVIRISLTAFLTLLSLTSVFGDEVGRLQKEIDRTVWTPFQKAFESLDGDALNSLYAASVLRVTPEGIDTEGAFKGFNESRFDENLRAGDRLALDFWFDSRHTNTSTSYEVGFYRMAITSAASTSHFYGQFHIVLRKIGGQWKIVQDWDTTAIAGRPLDSSDFARQPPAEFIVE